MEVSEEEELDESVGIIINGKYYELFNDFETNECMKLKDIVKFAKENGYKYGTITVISESWTSGAVYRYNNYGKNEWCKLGDLIGFA